MKAAYPSSLADWQRGIMLLNRRQVLLQDEVRPLKAADICWNFHTHATIAIAGNGSEATLSEETSRLSVRILSPSNAKFEVLSINPPAPQRPATDVRNLIIRLPRTGSPTTIAIWFGSPDEQPSASPVMALSQWGK